MLETLDLPIPSASLDGFIYGRERVAAQLDQIFALLVEIDHSLLSLGALGGVSSLLSPSLLKMYGRETLLNDLIKSQDTLKKRLDAELWDVLFKASGVRSFMDAEARARFQKSRDKLDIVPLTKESLKSTFRALYADRDEMFANGVENLFRGLSWDHRTNSPVAFGRKLILRVRSYMATTGLDPSAANTLDDLVRALCVLSGKPEPDHRHGMFQVLGPVMSASARGEWSGEFFRVHWYKNGMGHFEFLDPELVLKLNKVLASRYPAALAHVR